MLSSELVKIGNPPDPALPPRGDGRGAIVLFKEKFTKDFRKEQRGKIADRATQSRNPTQGAELYKTLNILYAGKFVFCPHFSRDKISMREKNKFHAH